MKTSNPYSTNNNVQNNNAMAGDNASSNDNEVFLNDYATRYEDLLLENRKIRDSLQKGIYEENHSQNSTRSRQVTNEAWATAALLSNHASMNGMLQCATKASKYANASRDTVDSIHHLLEQTLHCNDYGVDIANTSYPKMHPNHSQSQERASLGGLLTELALQSHSEFTSQIKQNEAQGKSFMDQNCESFNGFDSDQEMEDFFEQFPECKHESYEFVSVQDDSCIQEFIKNEKTETLQKKNKQSRTVHTQTIPMATQTSKLPSNNPYNQNQSNPYRRPNSMMSNNQSQRFDYQQDNNSSWESYDARQEDQRIVKGPSAPQNTTNAFSTAYEIRNDKSVQDKNTRHDDRQVSNENPYQEYQPNNPHRPNLSEGLKRKFQNPRAKANNSTGSNSNGNGGQRPNQNNGRQAVPQGNSNSSSNNKTGNDEDDELPEELQGLDKELVNKIESEIIDDGVPITFDDIAGLRDAKQTVMELVCWPLKRPDLFTGLRRGPNGLLLFGPPGTGKTLIGKAIAYESGATFFSISASSLTSKWIGEGEKLVRTLFAVAAYREPSVVFLDEIDSLLTQRKADENEASRRIKTEFLVQLDGTGTKGRVLAIGATNRPSELDDAARRRFVKRLYIPLPEPEDREILLRTLLKKNKHILSDKEIAKISKDKTNGFSGADLKALCTDAALGPIRQLGMRALEIAAEDVPPISYVHFKHALKGMNPSVAQSDLDAYLEFNQTYGSKAVGAEDYDSISDDESESETND